MKVVLRSWFDRMERPGMLRVREGLRLRSSTGFTFAGAVACGLAFAVAMAPPTAAAMNIAVVGDSLSAEYRADADTGGLLDLDIAGQLDTDMISFGNKQCGSQTIGEVLGFGGGGLLGFGGIGVLLDIIMPIFPMYTDFPARNWVQMLALDRSGDFNFGSLTDNPNLYGEPRLRGYEYNFARVSGTITSPGLGDHNMAQQVGQLIPYIQTGAIDVVVVNIGSNDFAAWEMKMENLCEGGPFYDPGGFQDQLIAELFAQVDALTAAGANKILIAELPMGTAMGTNESVVAAIVNTNARIQLEAAARSIPTFDAWGFNQDPTKVNPANGDLLIGGYAIPVDTAASVDDATSAGSSGQGVLGACDSDGNCGTLATTLKYLATDGLHPNTPPQGFIANEVIKALNANFGYSVTELTDQEILEAGGTFEPGYSGGPVDPNNWVQIRQKGPNKCLTIHSNNTNMKVSSCSTSNSKQKWHVLGYDDGYVLMSKHDGRCIQDDGWRYSLATCNESSSQVMDIYGGGSDRNWFINPDSRNTCMYRYWLYEGGKVYGSTGNCGLTWGWNYMRWGFYSQGSSAQPVQNVAQ